MGFTAQEFEAMSVWQFSAQMIGWAKQFEHSGMSETEKEEMWAWLQEKDDVPLRLNGGRAH